MTHGLTCKDAVFAVYPRKRGGDRTVVRGRHTQVTTARRACSSRSQAANRLMADIEIAGDNGMRLAEFAALDGFPLLMRS
jgi:hypothetical protein